MQQRGKEEVGILVGGKAQARTSSEQWGDTKRARVLNLMQQGVVETTARNAAEKCGMSTSHARQTLRALVDEGLMHVARRLTVESRSGKALAGEVVYRAGQAEDAGRTATRDELLGAGLGREGSQGYVGDRGASGGERRPKSEALQSQMALMGALYGGNWTRSSQCAEAEA